MENTPHIYWFTRSAIDKGAPTILTYVASKTSEVYVRDAKNGWIVNKEILSDEAEYSAVTTRDVVREKIFHLGTQLKGETGYNYKADYSRDEYPYASTLEGGTDAFWAYVPKAEQCIQGGQLGALYRALQNGEQFRVDFQP